MWVNSLPPLLLTLQCIFLVWCFLPMKSNGAAVLYYRVIQPLVSKNETAIGEMTRFASEAVKDVGGTGKICSYLSHMTSHDCLMFVTHSVAGAVKTAGSKLDVQTVLEAKAKVDAKVDEWSKKDE